MNNPAQAADKPTTTSSNPDRKKMIQQGFDTVAAGYDHPSLSFFPETAKRLVAHLVSSWCDVIWNAGWRALLNQMPEDEQKAFEEIHRKEIADVSGSDGVWFNTEVLITVGEKQ